MSVEPWNWVWTAIAVVAMALQLLRIARWRLLTPVSTSAAVAAALAWAGVGGSNHFLIFPVVPLVALTVTALIGRQTTTNTADAVLVPFGAPRPTIGSPNAVRLPDPRAGERTAAMVSSVLWLPSALVAIEMLVSNVTSVGTVAVVFPLIPIVGSLVVGFGWRRPWAPRLAVWALPVAAGVAVAVRGDVTGWRIGLVFLIPILALGVDRLDGESFVFQDEGAARWLVLIAPLVGLSIVAFNEPTGPIPVPTTTTTTTAATGTTAADPVEFPAIFVDVRGLVPGPDGTSTSVPVFGAFITFVGEGESRFQLSDVAGHAFFFADPGSYDVFVEPPNEGWALLEGCIDRIDDYPLAEGEEFTWIVVMVDVAAAAEHGSPPPCETPNMPQPGRLW